MRKSISKPDQTEVLLRSARRCCLCYGLKYDLDVKKGQIAHVDHDSSNNSIGNLAYLCFDHHDEYDTTTRQSKGLTQGELVEYRKRLEMEISKRFSDREVIKELTSESEERSEVIHEIVQRYWMMDYRKLHSSLGAEISARARKIADLFEAYRRLESEVDQLGLEDEAKLKRLESDEKAVRKHLGIPDGVWGISSEGTIDATWIEVVEDFVDGWTHGTLTWGECSDLRWELDDRYDFDPHYVLYGIPNSELEGFAYQYLMSFVYEFGMRNVQQTL